ncbi:4-hydroxy-tetrahydrodipicolinate synthase [Virgibacillus siamensis]|uniref:4-hydroxy-tetrahydrodipicolinate synthase n=1 Tax=Virgibacillus siamensis TaxID=480071 RepID=UPI0009868C77|nr:4-hydroxy-tetrahydrodipicolinate synthase [Virgibacillus siamensis]
MNFGRVLTAMVTPFNVNGDIDYQKTAELIEYLLDHGTEGLVIAGTTGESPTLTKEEKISLLNHTIKTVNKRVPVIMGTGSNNTAASISLTKEAEACGADAIMLVAPYYNKPSQRGLYEHFSAIANESALPVMLYNIPGRSVVKMDADTIVQLSKVKNIVSVKEASGDLDLISEVIERTSDDFTVYSGEDSMTLPLLAVGGDGVVSVASHVIGNEMQQMVGAFLNGDVKQAGALHRKLLPVMNGLFAAPSPSPVKAALRMKGVETGSVRLPLLELTDVEKQQLQKILTV